MYNLPRSNALPREWPWGWGLRVVEILWKVGVEYEYEVSWVQVLVL